MKSTLGKFGMMLSLLAVLFASIFVLSSCDCKHKKWSEWTVTEEETCGKAGQEKRNCLKCGAMQTREIGATLLHNFVTIPDVKATCTENGYTTYDVCYDCGFSMSEPTVIPATGHDIYTHSEVPATCTSEGRTEWASCMKCGIVTKEKEVIPKLAHTPEVVEGYPASCTTNGLTDGSKCSVCKTTLTERETIPAFGHTEVEVKGYAATCTESGLTDGTQCSVCSNWIVSQSVISPLQHDLIRVEGYAPTCENTGLSSYNYCNRCDYSSEPSVIPANGHNETAKLGYPATCTEPGRKDGVKCHTCQKTIVEGEEIPAKGHNIITLEGREPSCVVQGITDGQMCNVCGEVLVAQEVIPKLGHNMVIDTERSYPPSCAKMGCNYYTCSNGCGTQDNQYIDKLPHAEVIQPAVAPTLSSTGLTEGKYCSVCNTVIVVQIVLDKLAEFTAISTGNGQVSIENAAVSPGEKITITATPDEGYYFLGWFYVGTDTCISSASTNSFTVRSADGSDENLNHVEARFKKLEVIVINTNYNDVVIEGNTYYKVGNKAKLTVVLSDGYLFDGWYEGNKRVSTNLTIEFIVQAGGRTLEARFKKTYTFTLHNENPEMGSVSWNDKNGDSKVYETDTIKLTATPKEHYKFVGWYDDEGLIYAGTERIIAMPANDYMVYAKFDYEYYDVYVNADKKLSVDLKGEGTYRFGETVTVKATPISSYLEFLGWYVGGECVSTESEYTFVMTGSKISLKAEFGYRDYTLTVVTNYPDEIETQTFTYKYNTEVMASDIINNEEYKFIGWYIEGLYSAVTSIVVKENQTVEARYAKRYNISASTNNPLGTITCADKAYVGDPIDVSVQTEDSGLHLVGYMYDGRMVPPEYFTYARMPEGDVDITAIFGRYRNINVVSNYADSSISISAPTEALEFSKITVKWSTTNQSTYKFRGWYINGELVSTDTAYSFEVPEGDGELTIEARCAHRRWLRTNKNYSDAPYAIVSSSEIYEGDLVTITAVSNEKYRFVGWYMYVDGSLVSTDAEYTFIMPEHDVGVIVATYEYIDYTVKTSASYPEITEAMFSENKYHYGDSVTVRALSLTPTFKFLGWYQGDELVSSELEYSFAVTSNADLVAKYARIYNIGKDINYGDAASLNIPTSAYVGDEVSISISNIAEVYRFDGWYIDGELVSGDAEYSFKMPEGDVEIVAKLSKLRAIEIEKNYADAPKPQAPENAYEGENVTLIAVENELYKFVGWYVGGELAADTQSYSFKVPEADVSLEARFIKRYNITVNKNHPDSPDATYPNSQLEGERVTALAGENTKFYQFIGWYLDGELVTTEREYSFDMPSGDVTLEVRYVKLYRVETSIDRDGDLTDAIDTVYAPGETVTLNAHLLDGYRFMGWYSGDERVSGDITYSFAMSDSNVTLVERYLKTYSVNVSVNYSEIEVSDSITGLVIGESVDLVASEPSEQYVFDGWYIGDECIADTLTVTVTVDGDVCVEARYIKKHQVTFIGNDAEITGGGYYLENETVTVTAQANVGYRFDGWYIGGELVSTDKEYTFTMPDHDVEITLDIFEVWDGQMSDGFSGGSGTMEDPYLISHASELKYLAYLVNEVETQSGYYKLIADIDMGGHEWEPIGTKHSGGVFNIYYNSFTGNFNGDGYTIKNYKITNVGSSVNYIGLFGGTPGVIRNLNVCDFEINLTVASDETKIGAIVGFVDGGVVTNCTADGQLIINGITASSTQNVRFYVGMIAGYLSEGTISNCKAFGDLSVNASSGRGTAYVGGVLGGSYGRLMYSSSYAHISANTTIGTYVGGLLGSGLDQGFTHNCYNESTIEVYCDGGYIGGIAGSSANRIGDSYSAGSIYVKVKSGVSSETRIGGIAGSGEAEYCFIATEITVDGSLDPNSKRVVVGLSVGTGSSQCIVAINNVTVTAYKALIKEGVSSVVNYSYRYENQKIIANVTEYTEFLDANLCTLEQLNSKELYVSSYWSTDNWDLSELDFEAGKYPTLIMPE